MRQKASIIYMFFGILLVSLSNGVVAQNDEQDSALRLVCIETIGCLYTPLDDEALDVMFGEELERFSVVERGVVPDGVWADYTTEVTICDETTVWNENEIAANWYIFEPEGDGRSITVTDYPDMSPTRFIEIGAGVYTGEVIFGDFAFGDPTTWIQFTLFLVIIDEDTMRGIGIGHRIDADVECPQTSLHTYRRIEGG